MLTAGLAILYLPLHFAAYALFFRRHSFFRTEKGIFLLHFASASVLPFVVFALCFGFCSLTEGSYSFAILRAILRNDVLRETDFRMNLEISFSE